MKIGNIERNLLTENIRFGQREITTILKNKDLRIGLEFEYHVNEEIYDNDDRVEYIDDILKSEYSDIYKHIKEVTVDASVVMGVETITYPMKPEDALVVIKRMFHHINNYGNTSERTGLHANISFKGLTNDNLKKPNYLKILILSDEKTSKLLFGKRGYVDDYLGDIHERIHISKKSRKDTVIEWIGDGVYIKKFEEYILDVLENGQKYRRINYKNLNLVNLDERRLEFRFMGDRNYQKSFNSIKFFIARSAYITLLSYSNKDFEKEYKKELVKFINEIVYDITKMNVGDISKFQKSYKNGIALIGEGNRVSLEELTSNERIDLISYKYEYIFQFKNPRINEIKHFLNHPKIDQEILTGLMNDKTIDDNLISKIPLYLFINFAKEKVHKYDRIRMIINHMMKLDDINKEINLLDSSDTSYIMEVMLDNISGSYAKIFNEIIHNNTKLSNLLFDLSPKYVFLPFEPETDFTFYPEDRNISYIEKYQEELFDMFGYSIFSTVKKVFGIDMRTNKYLKEISESYGYITLEAFKSKYGESNLPPADVLERIYQSTIKPENDILYADYLLRNYRDIISNELLIDLYTDRFITLKEISSYDPDLDIDELISDLCDVDIQNAEHILEEGYEVDSLAIGLAIMGEIFTIEKFIIDYSKNYDNRKDIIKKLLNTAVSSFNFFKKSIADVFYSNLSDDIKDYIFTIIFSNYDSHYIDKINLLELIYPEYIPQEDALNAIIESDIVPEILYKIFIDNIYEIKIDDDLKLKIAKKFDSYNREDVSDIEMFKSSLIKIVSEYLPEEKRPQYLDKFIERYSDDIADFNKDLIQNLFNKKALREEWLLENYQDVYGYSAEVGKSELDRLIDDFYSNDFYLEFLIKTSFEKVTSTIYLLTKLLNNEGRKDEFRKLVIENIKRFNLIVIIKIFINNSNLLDISKDDLIKVTVETNNYERVVYDTLLEYDETLIENRDILDNLIISDPSTALEKIISYGDGTGILSKDEIIKLLEFGRDEKRYIDPDYIFGFLINYDLIYTAEIYKAYPITIDNNILMMMRDYNLDTNLSESLVRHLLFKEDEKDVSNKLFFRYMETEEVWNEEILIGIAKRLLN